MSNNMPWGIKDLKPGVHKTINADKLKKFDRGFQPKRNKYKQKKMQEELKRKKAEEEAAKAYQDFYESFQVDENERGQPGIGFVEGGSMGGTGGTSKRSSRSSRDEPPVRGGLGFRSGPPSSSSSSSKRKSSGATKKSSKLTSFADAFEPPTVQVKVRKKRKRSEKKKSNMEMFLEEMKRENALKEERRKRGIPEPKVEAPPPVSDKGKGMKLGHHDTGDPTTTNIYVGNLSPQVSEEFLVREFGKFGDIASVKIMWPRTQEEHNRQRNCGFVSFMKRPDAEDAIKELQGRDFYGMPMRLGWGKKVSLPSQPLRIPKQGETLGQMMAATAPVIEQALEIPSDAPRHKVVLPSDRKVGRLIGKLASYVAKHGHVFEKAVMNKEMKNPKFFFLFQVHTPEHLYYRWKVYMLSQGDSEAKWREEPFQMLLGGPYWIPPKLEDVKKQTAAAEEASQSKEEDRGRSPQRRRDRRDRDRGSRDSRRDRRKRGSSRRLRSRERDEFEDRLRGLSLNKTKIAYGMGFALDHAEEAKEIVEIITESLSLDETPIPKKVARLFLVSDILYNSTAPVRNASAYRTEFRDKLPKIFECLHRTYKSIEGRITANAMRERVTKVLRVWQVWSLYPESFVNGLETTFLGKEAQQKIVEPAPAPAAPAVQQPQKQLNLLGGAYDSDDDEAGGNAGKNKLAGLISTEDIDGAPIDGDIDGEPLDVDGEPLEDEDVDGVPIADDDIDGAPLS